MTTWSILLTRIQPGIAYTLTDLVRASGLHHSVINRQLRNMERGFRAYGRRPPFRVEYSRTGLNKTYVFGV